MREDKNKPEVINDEKYRIYSKIAILSILQSIVRNKSRATCYFGRTENFFLTTILSIDTQRNGIVLDYGPDESVNQKALQTNKLNIVAFPDQVKIQFNCVRIERIAFEGRNAFRTLIPESLLRMQKREDYRVTIPTIVPVKCAILVLEEDSSPETVEVTLQNISCGGMAVVDPKCEAYFKEGSVYRNCLIALPGIGTAKVNVRIRRIEMRSLNHGNNLNCQRVSCDYVDTDKNTLSMIQRYITKLELEQKRKFG
jgi:c-di-GMP-binding flagellar brake protein YcgR